MPPAPRPRSRSPRSFGTSHPNGTPRQAFGAGFREAVAHGLVGGRAPGRSQLASQLPPVNLKRLLVWATIGADQDNGLWCLYGARLGCKMAQLDQFDPALLVRPDWIEQFWDGPDRARLRGPGDLLPAQRLRLGPDPARGRRARARGAAPPRAGARDRRAGRAPEPLAEIGLVARFRRLGVRPPGQSVSQRLRSCRATSPRRRAPTGSVPCSATAMRPTTSPGCSSGARVCPRMSRRRSTCWRRRPAWEARTPPTISRRPICRTPQPGAGRRRPPSCCGWPARRGFLRAHATLAELYRSGQGVPHDPETALVHGLLAGDAGAAIALALRGELDAAQVSRAEQRAGDWRAGSGDQTRGPGQPP